MKHLKTFEQFSQEYNAGHVDEIFGFGKKTMEQMLEKAPEAFMTKLKEMEDMAAKGGEKVVFNKENLVKQAYENKFRGELKAIPSRGDGRLHIIYKDGLSTIQKIAAGSGAMTVGESIENDEANEGLLDKFTGVKKYKLSEVELSPKAAELWNTRAKLVGTIKDSLAKNLKLDAAKAEQAAKAVFNFANGAIPVMSRWNIDYMVKADELVVNPNGGGLFNGHPIMG